MKEFVLQIDKVYKVLVIATYYLEKFFFFFYYFRWLEGTTFTPRVQQHAPRNLFLTLNL